jgi:hypothetical protein
MRHAHEEPLHRLRRIGYSRDALERVLELAEGRFDMPADVQRVLDNFPYERDWARDYRILSAQAALLQPNIMCLNAAILSYALLEAFPRVQRQLLVMHRRGPDGMECGHAVTVYHCPGGSLGAFSKSNYAVLGHRAQHFPSVEALAIDYAAGYTSIGITPLYYGTLSLDDLPGIDWRLGSEPLTDCLPHITASYEYAFELEPASAAACASAGARP